MNIVSIGTDRNIFKEESPAQARMIEYGALFDELHIIVFAQQHLNLKNIQIARNVWVYPTNSRSKIGAVYDAFKIGTYIINKLKTRISTNAKKDSSQKIIVTTQDPFETGLVGYALKNVCDISLHVQVHIDFYSPYYKQESMRQRVHTWIGPFILRRANGIRVVSQKISNYLTTHLFLNPQKIMVLPIYTPQEETDQNVNLHTRYPQFSTILLIASRLVPQKNIPLALYALKKVVLEFPEVGLLIVGSGKEEFALKKMVRELGLEKVVVFEPWALSVRAYYRSADIFLLPSNYEGWGLTAVEASTAGVPVLMTNVGCAGEFIVNGENGRVVDVGDSDEFALALKNLISDKTLRNHLKEGGMKSRERLMTQQTYLDLYRESYSRM